MKLLFLTEYFPSTARINIQGGIEARAFFLAQELSKKHSVTVISSLDGVKPETQNLGNIRVVRVGPRRSYTRTGFFLHRIVFMVASFKEGLRFDFDIVEASSFFSWLPGFFLALSKRAKGVLIVADDVKEYVTDVGFLPNLLLQFLQRIIFWLPWTQIICISKTVKQKILLYGIDSKKISVIYCGAALDYLRQIPQKKDPVLSICVISRLVPYKRVHDVIDAHAILINKYPTLKLFIVGSGEEEFNLKEKVQKNKLEGNVWFSGYQNDYAKVIERLKESYIFCFPSLVEGFGIVTIEAFAVGKPAVLPDLPIHREITRNKGALFFIPGSSSDLAAKIAQLLSNRRLYMKLTQETYKIAKHYDWKQIAKQTEREYSRLLTY